MLYNEMEIFFIWDIHLIGIYIIPKHSHIVNVTFSPLYKWGIDEQIEKQGLNSKPPTLNVEVCMNGRKSRKTRTKFVVTSKYLYCNKLI